MKSRRAILVEPKRFEIHEVDVEPGPGQVMVQVGVCGLCNWEMNHWHGKLGTCPQSIGHEAAGIVAELGANVTGFAIGDRVTGYGGPGHSEFALYNQDTCFHLADEVPLGEALGEPLACICNVVNGTEPQVGDFGVIVGCGPMGLWAIQALAGNTLAGLIAVDVADWKLDFAKQFGASHTINPKSEDAVARIREITGGHMADFVIEGTGVPAVIQQGMSYLRGRRGRLSLMSAHEEVGPAFDWQPMIAAGHQIRATHPGWSMDNKDDLRRAILLLNQRVFRSDQIISHRFPLENIQEAFETVENKPPDFLKGVVIPNVLPD